MSFKSLQLSVLLYLGLAVAFGCAALLMRFLIPQPGIQDSWESLDSKEIKPVNLKGNQHWILIGRTDAKVEAPILWRPDGNSWLIGKRPWGWERLKAEGEESKKDEVSDGITDAMDMNSSKLWGMQRDREPWRGAVHGVAKSWTQLSNWTDI